MTKLQEQQSGTGIVLTIAPSTAFDTIASRQTNDSPGEIEER